ncbi:LacI family transcriptional regulator [Microlunatus endophyticus]|uniref:LacI family transcriptional regulator n=1 Tax=Microlunatus endophyticus TaxID=1716077 RepID=A0A917SD17_9ACTN|nr:LacI family DNA-binding transcriptional regulator [Microlunatus endophyticus]GGL70031.1 LacI family transcriptional regulator [Microlunatus endophyticus]
MPATLRDVATRSGVSLRTVYYVLSRTVRIAPDTEAKVRQAMDDLGYRPNLLAQGLRKGRTQVLAMMVPELDVPYFSELVRIVIHAARERGYILMLDQTDGHAAREREMLDDLARTGLFDGIIVSSLGLTPEDIADQKVPIVLLGEHLVGELHDHVTIDSAAAAKDATNHLLDLGRTRIAAIGDQKSRTASLRTQGYLEAHRDRGVAVDDNFIVKARRYHRSYGADAVQRLWQQNARRPDGLFCYNDLLALGAMKELHRLGLRVPDDVAVIGFDDIEEGEYSIPGLSTVSPDKAQIGTTAIDLLADRIAGRRTGPGEKVVIDHNLVIRGSTSGTD